MIMCLYYVLGPTPFGSTFQKIYLYSFLVSSFFPKRKMFTEFLICLRDPFDNQKESFLHLHLYISCIIPRSQKTSKCSLPPGSSAAV